MYTWSSAPTLFLQEQIKIKAATRQYRNSFGGCGITWTQKALRVLSEGLVRALGTAFANTARIHIQSCLQDVPRAAFARSRVCLSCKLVPCRVFTSYTRTANRRLVSRCWTGLAWPAVVSGVSSLALTAGREIASHWTDRVCRARRADARADRFLVRRRRARSARSAVWSSMPSLALAAAREKAEAFGS